MFKNTQVFPLNFVKFCKFGFEILLVFHFYKKNEKGDTMEHV